MEHLLVKPADARALLVLAHGAGAGMRHAFLEQLAQALALRKVATFRYEFLYMEKGGGRPDPPAVAAARVREAVAEAARVMPGLPLFAGGKSITVILRSSFFLPRLSRTTYSPAATRRSSSADVGSPNPLGRGRSRFRSHVTRCTPGNPEPVRLRTVSPAAVVITSFTPSGCISRKEYVITAPRGGFDATNPKLPNPGCVDRSRYWYAGATSNRWIVSLSTESLNSSTGPTPTT